MKKPQQSQSSTSPQFLRSRIDRVRNQLNRLSDLISNDQKLNNVYIKKFLEEKHISSDSSQRETYDKTNQILDNVQQQYSSYEDNGIQISAENQSYSQTLSKFSTIKSKEADTTVMLKPDGDGLLSTLKQSSTKDAKENARTEENHELKFNIAKKKPKIPEESNQLFKHNFVQLHIKHKLTQSNKSMKCLNSGNRSKPNLSRKKSSKGPMTPHLSKRASTKLSGSNYNKVQSKHLFDDAKKLSQKFIQPVHSPKLNKINGNKFRQNIKKTIDIQNQQDGLAAKFHLNLSEHKSLMQRTIQKNNIQRLYTEQNKKFQRCVKQLSQTLIMQELDTDFKYRSESLKLLMVFLSQFSQTIRRFFKNKVHKIEMKFHELIRQTIQMLVKLPNRLHRNNIVSHVRYESFMSSRIAIHKPNSKLEEAVKCLREYMNFLYKNGLIQMTERQSPQSGRNIVEYYSHRSKGQKTKVKGKLSEDFKGKNYTKQYQTERKSNIGEDEYKSITIGHLKKSINQIESKSKTFEVSSKLSPKHKMLSPSGKVVKSKQVTRILQGNQAYMKQPIKKP